MNLLRVKDNNKKGFCRYFSKKRKAKENILPLINGKGQLAVTQRRLRNSNVFVSVSSAVRLPVSLKSLNL